jgi:hypothetical protein
MFESDFSLAQRSGIPHGFLESAREATYALQKEQEERSQARSMRIGYLRDAYKARLLGIIGAENFAAFVSKRAEGKKRLRQISASSDGDTLRGRAAIRQAGCEIMHDTNNRLMALGVNLGALRDARQEHHETINKLFTSDIDLSPDVGAIALPDNIANPIEWDIYRPPYDGSFWSQTWDWSDEASEPVIVRFLDQSSGQIGSSIRLRVDGADNDDTSDATVYTTHKIIHQMPVDGSLEGYIVLKEGPQIPDPDNFFFEPQATLSGHISEDLFGYADCFVRQTCIVSLRVFSEVDGWRIGGSSYVSDFGTGDTDGNRSWNIEHFSGFGEHRWFRFMGFSHDAGTWLMLEAAIENRSYFMSDDFSIDAEIKMNLELESVRVRKPSG